MKIRTLLITAGVCLASASPALAHSHHSMSHSAGFSAGFSHPWFGLDHLMAMIAVGLLSVRIAGRAMWVLPAFFLGMMTLGGLAGMNGIVFPFVEFAIALSVLVLGCAMAWKRPYSPAFAATVVGMAGLVHGHAHALEMPLSTSPTLYTLGFVLATATLHVTGIASGIWFVKNSLRTALLRSAGIVMTCVGLALMLRTI